MIKNAKQASSAKDTLKRMQQERIEVIEKRGDISDIRYQAIIDSYDSIIEELIEDIAAYTKLIGEGYHCFKNKTIEQLGEVLISARLAQGLSQKDVAEIVGIQEQQIQRYEQTDYESASLVRLLEVADALNVTLILNDIEILGKQPIFELPSDVKPDIVNEAEISVRSTCSLVFA